MVLGTGPISESFADDSSGLDVAPSSFGGSANLGASFSPVIRSENTWYRSVVDARLTRFQASGIKTCEGRSPFFPNLIFWLWSFSRRGWYDV